MKAYLFFSLKLASLVYGMDKQKSVAEYEADIKESNIPIEVAINLKDSRGYSPIHLAAESCDIHLAVFCLKHGADVNLQVASDITPLRLLICRAGKVSDRDLNDMPRMLDLFCKHGVTVDAFHLWSFENWIKYYPNAPYSTVLGNCLALLRQQYNKGNEKKQLEKLS